METYITEKDANIIGEAINSLIVATDMMERRGKEGNRKFGLEIWMRNYNESGKVLQGYGIPIRLFVNQRTNEEY